MTLAAAQPLEIKGEVGRLQAVVERPQEPAAATAFVVVCHPHPLHGGTMNNKVVTTLARAAHECGMPTIRFNFRGVGASEGSFDDGRGETRDALAAIAAGRLLWPGASLVLAGFSFGGYVALRASTEAAAGAVDRLLTVAPALGRNYASPQDIRVPACPWLVLQGDADDVVDPRQVADWAPLLRPSPEVRLLPGVGHFFHGALNVLHGQAAGFFCP